MPKIIKHKGKSAVLFNKNHLLLEGLSVLKCKHA